MSDQDLRTFLAEYEGTFPDDVLTIDAPVSAVEDVAAVDARDVIHRQAQLSKLRLVQLLVSRLVAS